MKKSKQKIKQIFVLFYFILFCLLPLQNNGNFFIEEALAKEIIPISLKEKRDSYFLGSSSVLKLNNNIKILIVPGHDDKYWGTEHNGIKEVELNRELAEILYSKLRKEPGFSVSLVGDKKGYTKSFTNFFKKQKDDIEDFIKNSQKDFREKIKDGDIKFESTNFHNKAPGEVATKLYGINMWANENDFDLVLHIHFNDYAGRYRDHSPKYSGFSIYIPEKQFKNHETSRAFAEKVFNRISKISAVSNLKQEKEGIVESQELIAIGSNETLDSAAMLIEYGYIYEPQFTDSKIRPFVMEELANQTYIGIKDYFGERTLVMENYEHKKDLEKTEDKRTGEVFMLQKDLALSGYFPPKGKTLNTCPVAGYFGDCTKEAVISFQKDKGIPPTGFVGPLTRKILNNS